MPIKCPPIKTIVSCCLIGAVIGFLFGGGCQLISNFDQWRSEIFYRAHDDEVVLLALWFWFGPARYILIGAVFGGIASSFLIAKSDPKSSQGL
jgi:hypothetical protein